MARVVAAQTVTGTPTKILTTRGGSTEEPDWYIIQNNSSTEALYIQIYNRGDAAGTSTTSGFPIPFGGSIQVNSVSPEDIWAMSSGSAPVSIITRF